MLIGLHDAEFDYMPKKQFPNYSLMKISSYHKKIGDIVEWWNPLKKYDLVYSSKVFSFTKENMYLPDDAIRGGTGYNLFNNLNLEIDNMFPDYSLYPKCGYSLGFITRGCINNCSFCIVRQKEGFIKSYRKWNEIVRQDTDKLVLMDNNILASEYGIDQLEELAQTDYKIDLNQGMDARLVTEGIADILAKIKWIRYIRFSCDQISQLDAIFNVAALLGERGIKPHKIFVYLLVTKDIQNAAYRVDMLKKLKNINIYAQAERNESTGIIPNIVQLEFTNRYIYGRCYKTETWVEYCKRKRFKWDTYNNQFFIIKDSVLKNQISI